MRNKFSLVFWVIIFFLFFLYYAPFLVLLKDFLFHFDLSQASIFLPFPRFLKILSFSLYQAALSAILSVIFGLFFALWLDSSSKLPKMYSQLLFLPFFMQPVLVSLGFVLLLGQNGLILSLLRVVGFHPKEPISLLYTFGAILGAHVFYNFPLAMRLIQSAKENIPSTLNQASSLCGASGWMRFKTITLPFLSPALLQSFLLIFLYTFHSFTVILMLGGTYKYATLETEIFRLSRLLSSYSLPTLLALIEMLCILPVVLYLFKKNRQFAFSLHDAKTAENPKKQDIKKPLAQGIFLIILLLPLLLIVFTSIKDGFFWLFSSFSAFRITFLRAITTTLALGLIASPLAVFLSFLASYLLVIQQRKKGWFFFFLSPLVFSSASLGLAYIVSASVPFLAFYRTIIGLVLAHIAILFPFLFLLVFHHVRSITRKYGTISSLWGSPMASFHYVILPLLRPVLLSAFYLGLTLSFGELTITMQIAPTGIETVPMAMARFMASYKIPVATLLGSFLLLVSFFLIFQSQRRMSHEN